DKGFFSGSIQIVSGIFVEIGGLTFFINFIESVYIFHPVRYFITRSSSELDSFLYAYRIPDFKRTVFPAKTSTHRVVYFINFIGNLRNFMRNVSEQRSE